MGFFKELKYREDQILIDEIYTDYLPLGYTEFKISGRHHGITIAFNTVRHLIKPEYQLIVLKELMFSMPFA